MTWEPIRKYIDYCLLTMECFLIRGMSWDEANSYAFNVVYWDNDILQKGGK